MATAAIRFHQGLTRQSVSLPFAFVCESVCSIPVAPARDQALQSAHVHSVTS